jgi:predicted GNAT family acetyltransferase
MNVELVESVDEFIASTAAFRAGDPLRTNVIGSVSLAVSKGHQTYDDYRWWVVRDDDVAIVGVAMRTHPFKMTLSPMPHDAARSLGHDVGRFDDGLTGITGPADVLQALVSGYVESKSPGSSRALVEERRDLLYELEELVTPDVDGFGRPARAEEIDALSAMLLAFMIDVGIRTLSSTEARDHVKKAVTAGTLFCWELDGGVVAMAGHAGVVTTEEIMIGRVGPVYTPPEYRGHGFGSAVTAHVSQHLVGKGARVMLFTDAANPTSNSIYQKIGYRLIDELVETLLQEA